MEHSFMWVEAIPGLRALPPHLATSVLVALALLGFAGLARRRLAALADPAVPDATLTVRNATELYVEGVTGLVEGVLGQRRARAYVHLYGSLFVFILAANLTGLVPGFTPPTGSFNVTFALGVVSFLAYNYYGFRENGVSYLKHFVGPVWWLGVLMVPLELIDNIVRPFSLSLRLFGNMTGDHMVLEIFTDLTKVAVPVIFYVLGAFVSFIQAFVFTLLSLIYVSLAIAHEH